MGRRTGQRGLERHECRIETVEDRKDRERGRGIESETELMTG